MRLKPRIGTYGVYEFTEQGWKDSAVLLAQMDADLRAQGLDVITAPEPVCDEESCRRVASFFQSNPVDVLHPLMVTWSFDHYTYLIQQANPVPVAIRAIPDVRTGSLVGGNQLNSVLFDLDVARRLYFGKLGDQPVANQTAAFASACALRRQLRGATFAFLGRRTPGMTDVSVDEVELMRLFGVRLIYMGMDEFSARVERVSIAKAEQEWTATAGRAAQVTSDPASSIASMRFYLALGKLIQEYRLAGYTIGNYPTEMGLTCLPNALWSDTGIATGCEGDLNATIVMYMLSQLSDSPVHFGEILDADEDANTILSSHCGSAPPSLASADGYILCPVRLMNIGVCIRFTARTGPITFVSMAGRRANYRLCAVEGEAIPTKMVFDGNPMRIRLKSPFRRTWEAIGAHGAGHHWMAAYAHVAPILIEFCQLTGIQGIFPDLEG